MDRRWNLLLIGPLALAVFAFAATGDLIYATVGLIGGMLLLQAFRFLALPPHLHQAVKRYQSGQLEEALELADKSIAKRDDRWESYNLRALIHFGLTQLNRAEKDARQALALKPNAHPVYLVLGQVLFAQTRYAAAADTYQEALRYGEKDAPNHYYLGLCRFRLEAYEAASQSLSQALTLGLDNPSLSLLAHFYLGQCLEQLGRAEEAATVYAQLPTYEAGLDPMKSDLYAVANYPALPALKADVAQLTEKLAERSTR